MLARSARAHAAVRTYRWRAHDWSTECASGRPLLWPNRWVGRRTAAVARCQSKEARPRRSESPSPRRGQQGEKFLLLRPRFLFTRSRARSAWVPIEYPIILSSLWFSAGTVLIWNRVTNHRAEWRLFQVIPMYGSTVCPEHRFIGPAPSFEFSMYMTCM